MDSVQLQGNHLSGAAPLPETERPAQTQQQSQTASQPTATLPAATELSEQQGASSQRQFDLLANGRYQKAELHDALLGQTLASLLPQDIEALLNGQSSSTLQPTLEQQIFDLPSFSAKGIANPSQNLSPELQALADLLLSPPTTSASQRSDTAPLHPATRQTVSQLTGLLGREEVKSFIQRNGEQGLTTFHRLAGLLQDLIQQNALPAKSQQLLLGKGAEYLTALVTMDQYLASLEREFALQPRRVMEATLRALQKHNLTTPDKPRVTPQELMQVLLDEADDALELDGQAMSPRARKIWKLVEYLRLLDTLDQPLEESVTTDAQVEARPRPQVEGSFRLTSESDLLGETALSLAQTAFANRGVVEQIPSLLQSLRDGIADEAGHALLTHNGTPLKPEKLLWLNVPEHQWSQFTRNEPGQDQRGLGLFAPVPEAAFDAVYQLVGFDPRAMNGKPLFLGIKTQASQAEARPTREPVALDVEALFRTIERLKDSLSTHENSLGEMLEEALVEERLHLLLLRGAAQNGQPLAHTLNFEPLAQTA